MSELKYFNYNMPDSDNCKEFIIRTSNKLIKA